MRLWHKDLIDVLPDNQLKGQWRECCLITKALHDGNLNHLLVNKVKDYAPDHLWTYGRMVHDEMRKRGYKVDFERFNQWFPFGGYGHIDRDTLFDGWHNDRYLLQCYYNLQEKYDCGGISEEEWKRVEDRVREVMQ